jgi:hypothetical protein
MAASQQGAYSGTREEQALAWVEEVTGMSFDGDELGMALHNGVALAELANKLMPGTIRKISHSRMPFPQRENIAAFIEAARLMGVPEHQLFETSDLYEQANLKSVVDCLFEVGKVAYALPHYDGPALGPPPQHHGRARHHSATKGDALWGGRGGSGFDQAGAAARNDRSRQASGGPSIAAATSAGRKIQVERSSALKAFHELDASTRTTAMRHGGATGHVSEGWHAKIPTRKKSGRGPPLIPKGKIKHHPPVPHRKKAPAPGAHDYGADRAATEAQIHSMLTHNQDEQQLLHAHDELEALKALKADYSAQQAAEEAAANYSKYTSSEFDAHGELLSVQAEVAALRDELDVRLYVAVVWVSPQALCRHNASRWFDNVCCTRCRCGRAQCGKRVRQSPRTGTLSCLYPQVVWRR